MNALKWEIAPTTELDNGFYAWFEPLTTDGVSGFEVAQGSQGWGVALRGGDDNSWFIPFVDGFESMPAAAAAAEEIFALLATLHARIAPPAPVPEAPRAGFSRVKVVRDDEDGFAFEPDDEFWKLTPVVENERFDMIARGGGTILMRACPYDEATYALADGNHPHAEDPEFTPGSHCGLTKWTCAGCGQATIVVTEDDFPEGWLEVSARQPDGDTIAYESVCSTDCLARFANKGGEMRGVRLPGFSPATTSSTPATEVASVNASRVVVVAPPASIVMSIVEHDGTTEQTDISARASFLVRLAEDFPLSVEEEETRTSSLGEISCSDEVSFTRDGAELAPSEGLDLIGVGLYRCVQHALVTGLDSTTEDSSQVVEAS